MDSINRIFMVNNTFYSQGEPYQLNAYVHAENYESSKAQFKWLAETVNCLCTDCRNSWVSKYSTLIMSPPMFQRWMMITNTVIMLGVWTTLAMTVL